MQPVLLDPIDLLKHTQFEMHVGKEWLVKTDPQPITILLEQVYRPERAFAINREPFILFFSTPRNQLLVEGLYEIQAPGENWVSVYMAPITVPGPRQRYQAIFN